MWWKEGEERLSEKPAYTAQAIIDYYAKQVRPLEGETVYRLLEPLAGTSFLANAMTELGIHFRHQRHLTRKAIYPFHLLDCWYGSVYPYTNELVRDTKLLDEARVAIHSLLPDSFGIDNVYILDGLEKPSEMLLYQGRWDNVYHDEARTAQAFSLYTGQVQFYAKGTHLHTVAGSKLRYTNEAGALIHYTLLADGEFDTAFFLDGQRRVFNALSAEQQQWQSGYRTLCISPLFSLDAARKQ